MNGDRQEMKQEDILEVVRHVVYKQLSDAVVSIDKDELINAALVAVLEASQKANLSPAEIGLVAKREVINFKLSNWSNVSIPKGSLNYLRKLGQLQTDDPIESAEGPVGRKRIDKLQVLQVTIEKWKATKSGLERMLIDKLEDGLSVFGAWQELVTEGATDRGLDAMYDISRGFGAELRKLLGIAK